MNLRPWSQRIFLDHCLIIVFNICFLLRPPRPSATAGRKDEKLCQKVSQVSSLKCYISDKIFYPISRDCPKCFSNGSECFASPHPTGPFTFLEPQFQKIRQNARSLKASCD